jgi:hypothetical protein
MAKNKMYQPAGEKKNPRLVKEVSKEQLRKFEKAAQRNRRLVMETRPGQGPHGKGKLSGFERADRRNGKKLARNWQED